MGYFVLGGGEVDEVEKVSPDFIHENGSDLNLNENPEEDWGETVPPEQSE